MPRMKRMVQRDDGWCDWVMPIMELYRMACCDCGLVHDLQFRVFKETKRSGEFSSGPDVSKTHRVLFRAKRNNRSTSAIRKKEQVMGKPKSKPRPKPKY